jgi:hypothetical protein
VLGKWLRTRRITVARRLAKYAATARHEDCKRDA